jgi:hypothetical protein
MRIVPIKECLTMDSGEQPPAVAGVIADVYKRSVGVSAKTGDPWSLQNFILKDRQTGQSIKCCLSNRVEMAKMDKGKSVLIVSKSGAKGLSGLYIEENEYPKGTINKVLKITGSAEISDTNSASPSEFAEASLPPASQAAAGIDEQIAALTKQLVDADDTLSAKLMERLKALKKQKAEAAEAAKEAAAQKQATSQPEPITWEEASNRLLQSSKLYVAACQFVCEFVVPKVLERTGYAIGPEHIQGACATLFIEYVKHYGMEVPNQKLPPRNTSPATNQKPAGEPPSTEPPPTPQPEKQEQKLADDIPF